MEYTSEPTMSAKPKKHGTIQTNVRLRRPFHDLLKQLAKHHNLTEARILELCLWEQASNVSNIRLPKIEA